MSSPLLATAPDRAPCSPNASPAEAQPRQRTTAATAILRQLGGGTDMGNFPEPAKHGLAASDRGASTGETGSSTDTWCDPAEFADLRPRLRTSSRTRDLRRLPAPRLALTAALLLALLLPSATPGPAAASASATTLPPTTPAGKRIVAYYPTYWSNPVPDSAALEHLTHIVFFSLGVWEDGTLVSEKLRQCTTSSVPTCNEFYRAPDGTDLGRLDDDGSGNAYGSPTTMTRYINLTTVHEGAQLARRVGAKPMIAIGGAGINFGWSAMAADAAARTKFVQQLLSLCQQEQLAGVDLDWEWPGSGDTTNLRLLLTEMRAAFDPDSLLISMAVSASNTFGIPRDTYLLLDWVNIMIYDESGHGSAAKFASTMTNVWGPSPLWGGPRLPKERINMGVPFYAKGGMSWKSMIDLYGPIPELLDAETYQGKEYTGWTPMQARAQYVVDNSYGGIMIWELNQDLAYAEEWSLLRALNTVIAVDEPPLPDGITATAGLSRGAVVSAVWPRHGVRTATGVLFAAQSSSATIGAQPSKARQWVDLSGRTKGMPMQ